MNKLIKKIEIKGLFNKYDLKWNLNQDVNILVGINGIGKTTILDTVYALLSQKYSYIYTKDKIDRITGYADMFLTDGSILNYGYSKTKRMPDAGNSDYDYEYITTFDVSLKDRTKIEQNETPLDINLQSLIFPTAENPRAFLNYRLKATQSLLLAEKVNNKIKELFNLIDKLFSETNKKIEINPDNNNLRFKNGDSVIKMEQLSSGEKQLLIILFTVFLREEEPFVLLMDEPEISLHIGWQQQLIDVIRQLNPNCQLIIATHSPSIFGDGWGDKLFFVEDLIQMS